jgi:hypothetical protein
MGVVRYLNDKLVNLVANLGTGRDKASHNQFDMPFITDQELVNAYRGSWMARKGVEILPFDATREWRAWQADSKQIQAIEAEEKRLNVQNKVKEAMTKARLFGGAAIFIGTGDRDLSLRLDPERVQAGGIKYLNVMSKRQLTPGDTETDPQSEYFDKPKWYIPTGSPQLRIHPSRVIVFIGAPYPDNELLGVQDRGWGDSILLAASNTVKQSESVDANVASMVFEAKVDVVKIPNFMEQMDDQEYRNRVLQRLSLAATGKGINGMLMLDKEEDYETKSASFSNLPDIMDRFDQKVCGAFDVPAVRFLGQSPAGLSSSGESDLRNYYDHVRALQKLGLSQTLSIFDECLIRSALGSRPTEIYYDWRILWQPTAAERATIGKTVADTIKTLSDTQLFNQEALSKAATTTLVEGNVLPGLEAAIEEFGTEVEPEDPEEPPVTGAPDAPVEE